MKGFRPTILVVVGTRPEAIKLAPVIQALSAQGWANVRVCLTGQHRELLAQGVSAFDLPVHRDLALMSDNQSLPELTARILSGLSAVIAEEAPSWIIVQGDTTTALAAALAAHQNRVPIAHVEAGLRSGDTREPWPEETNRRLIAGLATLHFAPTEGARRNLIVEGVPDSAIEVTGNTVIDALQLAMHRLDARPSLGDPADALAARAEGRRLALLTVHRRENLDSRLPEIARAVAILSRRGDCTILFPAHPNPRLSALVEAPGSDPARLHVVSPLDYLPFVALMRRADLILTDSGGIQEEASALGKPVLVLRNRTERPEAIEGGNTRLVGTRSEDIVHEAGRLLDDEAALSAMARQHRAFGDGQAAARIVQGLAERCGVTVARSAGVGS